MKARITYWQEKYAKLFGFLKHYPDHRTQGDNLEDLREQLRDLYRLFSSENILGFGRQEELEVA